MTEKQSKDSTLTELTEDLAKPAGCYGITSPDALSIWLDHWEHNGGEREPFDDMMMIVDRHREKFTLWSVPAVWPEDV